MTDTPPQIPAFSPEDLVAAIQLIDEGVNQGSFKGWEAIQKAIAVRARLLLFAQHWQGTIEAQQQALAEAEAANAEGDSAGGAAGESGGGAVGETTAPKKTRAKKNAA